MINKEIKDKTFKLLKEKVELLDKTKKEKEEILKLAEKRYENMLYDSGEAIGVVAAQSVSEPATQTTLKSYHRESSGLNIIQGLPRVIEILDARKSPETPTMKIYLLPEQNNKNSAKKIASNIKETKLMHLMVEDSLDLANMCIEINMDAEKMKNLDIKTDDLIKNIKKKVRNIEVKMSDDHTMIVESKKAGTTVQDLQRTRTKVRDSHAKGIPDIDFCIIEKVNDDWVLQTLGSNLRKITKIEGVDPSRVSTNNIFEVYETFGIEAARQAIINEILNTLRAQGVDTDIRHLLLIADAMTSKGEIKPIGRYGLSGAKSSVLARSNFEETVKHLVDASIIGEKDELKGIVENIIIGKTAKVASGLVELKMKD